MSKNAIYNLFQGLGKREGNNGRKRAIVEWIWVQWGKTAKDYNTNCHLIPATRFLAMF
jgi:predicted secreted Zn-dependent protease